MSKIVKCRNFVYLQYLLVGVIISQSHYLTESLSHRSLSHRVIISRSHYLTRSPSSIGWGGDLGGRPEGPIEKVDFGSPWGEAEPPPPILLTHLTASRISASNLTGCGSGDGFSWISASGHRGALSGCFDFRASRTVLPVASSARSSRSSNSAEVDLSRRLSADVILPSVTRVAKVLARSPVFICIWL